MIAIKRASTGHVALLYLRMKNTWVSVDDLYNLSPAKYEHKYIAKRALDRLVNQKLAIVSESMYHITQSGKDACYAIVREQPKYEYE
jgi:hypothetical protein